MNIAGHASTTTSTPAVTFASGKFLFQAAFNVGFLLCRRLAVVQLDHGASYEPIPCIAQDVPAHLNIGINVVQPLEVGRQRVHIPAGVVLLYEENLRIFTLLKLTAERSVIPCLFFVIVPILLYMRLS